MDKNIITINRYSVKWKQGKLTNLATTILDIVIVNCNIINLKIFKKWGKRWERNFGPQCKDFVRAPILQHIIDEPFATKHTFN